MDELKKDKECIHCVHFFDCAGKPKEVDLCINFKERNDDKWQKEECLRKQ